MNLEVALGARARNATLPVVMRIGDAAFASSIGRHFDIDTTFATAGLAAPAFAGLAATAGARGRVTIGDLTYGVSERVVTTPDELAGIDIVPLWAWRGGRLVAARTAGDLRPGDRLLYMIPLAQFRRERFRSRRAPAGRATTPRSTRSTSGASATRSCCGGRRSSRSRPPSRRRL